jgi:hypothetical protein
MLMLHETLAIALEMYSQNGSGDRRGRQGA